jgi:hypothetical protein
MNQTLHCHGALALEIAAAPARTHLERDQSAELAGHIADDLCRLLPGIETLDLSIAAAHFDPAEVLRPRWPVHAALSDLSQRAPGSGRGWVMGLGSHAGAMPADALMPDPAMSGGPLRLIPFVLHGEAERVAQFGSQMEQHLLETGMAGAATALEAQTRFGGRLEHARYLTLHDLCALVAMQYEHGGIAPLWPLIEAALLAPDADEWLDAPPEPLLRYVDKRVCIARPSFDAWAEAGFAPREIEPRHLPRAFDAHNQRLQQLNAVLNAHSIATTMVDVAGDEDMRAKLSG